MAAWLTRRRVVHIRILYVAWTLAIIGGGFLSGWKGVLAIGFGFLLHLAFVWASQGWGALSVIFGIRRDTRDG